MAKLTEAPPTAETPGEPGQAGQERDLAAQQVGQPAAEQQQAAIVGDDEPVALADRPAIKAVLAESDPRKALMLWVQTVAGVVARAAPLGEVLIAAAGIDPAAAQLLAEQSRNRMLGVTMFIRYLAALDGLAAGMTEQRAAELCWALGDGHLYRLLVAQRGWSTADFNRWLSGSLAAALLPT